MGQKSPEQELQEFLAKQPRWLQETLRWNFEITSEEALAFAQYGFDRFFELLKRYETLARRVPTEWQGYRRRRKLIALAGIPSGKAGRPRKDSYAEEVLELRARDKSYAEIAIEMKRRHPAHDKKHDRDATRKEADAVRKLIASRKARSGSEKI